MEKYILKNDLKVFGPEVKTFPAGIPEAFDVLLKKLPDGLGRSYYGISEVRKDSILYLATAEEKFDGEAEKYNWQRYLIPKGEYYTRSLYEWKKKTDNIKEIFHEMTLDSRVDKTKPCIEWYRDEKEMLCMVRAL